MVASKAGHAEVVKLLLAAGAGVHVQNKVSVNVFDGICRFCMCLSQGMQR
jgi:ankyrin repeat protein